MEQDERREAYRRELASILQFDSLKAEAVILRKKLDAEWSAVLGDRTEVQQAPAENLAPQVEVQARPSTVPYVTARSSIASIASATLTYCTARSRGESPANSTTRSPSPGGQTSDRSSEGWQSNRGAEEALRSYEAFHELPAGSASYQQLASSSARVGGWAAAPLDEENAAAEASTEASALPGRRPPAPLGALSSPPAAPAQSPRGPTPRGKGVPPGLPPKSLAASPRAEVLASEMPEGSPRTGGKGPPLPGKGKGKGGPPPPAKAKAKARPDAGDETPGRGAQSRLVNLHWRMSIEPQDVDVAAAEDLYLTSIVEVLPRQRQMRYQDNVMDFDRAVFDDFGMMDDGEMSAAASTPLGAGAATLTGLENPMGEETPRGGPMTPAGNAPGGLMTPARGSRRRARRNTIFSEDCNVRMMTQGKLEEYFQAKSSVIDMGPRASTGTIRSLINDAKHLQIIDVLVRKKAIHSQRSVDASVEDLILALRTCNYDVAPPQVLEDIRKVTMAHMEDRSKTNVVTFVEARGEEALQQLDHPHLHRLLYGALRIPAFNARLNCMIMEATCDDNLRHCKENLEVLRCGVECLSGLLDPLRHFFQVARLLGNTLNRDCSASVSKYGFKLSSLQKFYEMKLPTRKEISLLHFMALMMPPEQMDVLCNSDALDILMKARSARSFTVHQVCTQLLDGFRRIRRLVQTGKYKDSAGQEQEIPVEASAREAGSSDTFYERMRTFVTKNTSQVDFIEAFCTDVFEAYWAIGAFFDDTKYVYPPPADDQQQHGDRLEKKDLFEVFHDLLAKLSCVRKEVTDHQLAQEIERTFPVRVPINAASPKPSKIDAWVRRAPADLQHVGRDAVPAAAPARLESPVQGAQALRNYEAFHELPAGSATYRQVASSSASVAGWAAARLDEAAHSSEVAEAAKRSSDGGSSSTPSSTASSRVNHTDACPADWSPRDASPAALSSGHSAQTSQPASAKAGAFSEDFSASERKTDRDRISETKPLEVLGSPMPPPPKRKPAPKAHDVRRSQSSPNCSPVPIRRADSQESLESSAAAAAAMAAAASATAAPPAPAVPMPPPRRNPGLKLPGVQRVGTQLSSSSSSTTLSGGGSSPQTPSKKESPALSQCRKSLTNMALKAQKDGISRMLGETSEGDALQDALRGLAWGTDSANCSPEPSPRDELDLNPHGVALTLNQQIRDTARRRHSRGQASQPSPTIPSLVSPLPSPLNTGPLPSPEFDFSSGFRCDSPRRGRMRAESPDSRKRPLTPVYEHTREGSNSLTPARNGRATQDLQ